ncbi:hypothetical protein ES708_08985 [subsurface metagenome]
MTLREWLMTNFGKNCYNAGWATKTDLSKPDKYERVAELWLVPIELLNTEVSIETRKT